MISVNLKSSWPCFFLEKKIGRHQEITTRRVKACFALIICVKGLKRDGIATFHSSPISILYRKWIFLINASNLKTLTLI
jgi:hypothetical protein